MVEETVTAPAPAKATPKAKVSKAANATKPKQPKKPAAHPNFPKYEEMVTNKAVLALKERQGSSRQAIPKFILANFEVSKEEKPVNARLKVALKKAVAAVHLKQAKGTGATDRFRVGAKKASEKKPKAVKKPVAAKKPKVEKKTKTIKTPQSYPKEGCQAKEAS